jgi:predicted PurR-regulated permease PerM
MYEKNVVSRNVAIALAAISIVLFVGLVGVMSYNVFVINERSNETIASLRSQVASLQNDYNQLNASYNWYQTAYDQLQVDYSIVTSLRIGTLLRRIMTMCVPMLCH